MVEQIEIPTALLPLGILWGEDLQLHDDEGFGWLRLSVDHLGFACLEGTTHDGSLTTSAHFKSGAHTDSMLSLTSLLESRLVLGHQQLDFLGDFELRHCKSPES